MTTPSQKPSVKLVDGKPTTTSQQVANFFRKEHYIVMRAIKALDCSDEFRADNFVASEYTDAAGKKKLPAYIMTKNGFMFLAMWFTGEEAAKWKEAYIGEFDRLQQIVIEKLEAKAAPKELPNPEKKRYHYPRHMLEQEYFTSPTQPARLSISMLGHEKEFSSSLLELLLELGIDGHNVDAPYAEYMAMREGLIKARCAFDEIMQTALRASAQPASTAGN